MHCKYPDKYVLIQFSFFLGGGWFQIRFNPRVLDQIYSRQFRSESFWMFHIAFIRCFKSIFYSDQIKFIFGVSNQIFLGVSKVGQ